MTQPRELAQPHHDIAIIGAGAGARSVRTALQGAGVTDYVILDDQVHKSRFDDDTDTWRLTTTDGEMVQAHIVITADRLAHAPWLPDVAGRDDFAGESFHAAAPDPDFDPSGKHIAVVGTDTAAGNAIAALVEAAAPVTVFAYAPRRVVADVPIWSTRGARWLRRRIRPVARHPRVASTAIEAVTSSGIRTVDGIEHRVDVVIYGTGYSIPEDVCDQSLVGAAGLTIRDAWRDGMEPFCGVAVRGFPNYFFLTGPDIDAQARYIVECLKLMQRTGSRRIEVRGSSQQVFNERAQLAPAPAPAPASAFDLSSSGPEGDDTYDGAATLEIAGARHPVRVRLAGHLDPIDGRYHWQGTVFCSPGRPLPDDALKQARTATLTVGHCSAPARIVEQTPWGTHSVAGVGAPPYASSDR